MAPKKTVSKEKNVERTTSHRQVDHTFETSAEHAQPKVNQNQRVERTPLNHAIDNSLSVGGMQFRRSRGLLDGSTSKSLDIDRKLLNPELEYRWVNDENGRVDRTREMGYETVPEIDGPTGEKITTRRRVGTQKDGSPLMAHLMATPKQWKKEREDAQESQRQSLEVDLKRGTSDGNEKIEGKFYAGKNNRIE